MRKFSMILPAAAAAALALGIAGASATEPDTRHGECTTNQSGWTTLGDPIPGEGGGETTTVYYQGYSDNVVSEDNLNPGVSSITTISGSTSYQVRWNGNTGNTCYTVSTTEPSYEYDGPGNSPAEQNLCDRVDDCALGD